MCFLFYFMFMLILFLFLCIFYKVKRLCPCLVGGAIQIFVYWLIDCTKCVICDGYPQEELSTEELNCGFEELCWLGSTLWAAIQSYAAAVSITVHAFPNCNLNHAHSARRLQLGGPTIFGSPKFTVLTRPVVAVILICSKKVGIWPSDVPIQFPFKTNFGIMFGYTHPLEIS